jgi:hypothetical protein
MNARKSAKARWIERISVAFRTSDSPVAEESVNGSGDAM